MTAAVLTSLAPLTLGSTTLPTENLRVSPDVASVMHRTSGNEFGSVMAVLGGSPKISFDCTAAEAYTAIGFKGTMFTTCDVYLATFASGIRSAGSGHPKYALAASAKAFAYIRSISASQTGIAMASVEVLLLSSDGVTHPISPTTASLPALSAQPALRTLGPGKINGTAYAGLVSMNLDLAPTVEAILSDGSLYPQVCAYAGGAPVITVEHADPETLRGVLGFQGVSLASNYVQYLRDVDATTQTLSTTGISLTVASGRVIPLEFGASNLQIARGGYRVECLSTSTTHPVILATGATVPVL